MKDLFLTELDADSDGRSTYDPLQESECLIKQDTCQGCDCACQWKAMLERIVIQLKYHKYVLPTAV